MPIAQVSDQTALAADVSSVRSLAARIQAQVARVMVGKASVVELLLVSLFCEGHVLLEDVPGVGKTTLAKTLARSLQCSFTRIQFTPDLLPSDIVGVSIYNQKNSDFEYRAGPVMSQLLLADEINRAGPRTQAALLEAMEERQVTVDGVTRHLSYPFMVLATQNPVELDGTYPLPEAQLDRFLLRLTLGYPDREEGREILRRFRAARPLEQVETAATIGELRNCSELCRQVFVHASVEDYLLDLVESTRNHPELALGASPRSALALYHAGQALAAIRGRNYVTPQEIKELALPVLSHRLMLGPEARLRRRTIEMILAEILENTPAPVEEVWAA
jgi:MoxR-like ATPase